MSKQTTHHTFNKGTVARDFVVLLTMTRKSRKDFKGPATSPLNITTKLAIQIILGILKILLYVFRHIHCCTVYTIIEN